jgi:TATA-binding protein-associated factor Taf7
MSLPTIVKHEFIFSKTIESVEEQVERLLDEDALATEVKYG